MDMPRFALNTGAEIPAIGLGTWQSAKGEVAKATATALECGYRHIDCAFAYGNEDEVGTALAEAFAQGTVARADVFVTSKLWCTWHDRAAAALDETLKSLGLEYLDLYLMHWPIPMNSRGNHPLAPRHADNTRDLLADWTFVDTYKSMEALLATGKVKAIGVSNFSVANLEQLLASTSVVPAVNQIENHPYLPQEDIVSFCQAKGIHVTAYSPLGSTGSPLMQEPGLAALATKHGVSPANILLNFHVARGVSVLAKSVTPARIASNLTVVKLDEEDVTTLMAIHKDKGTKRYVWPDFGIDLGFPDVGVNMPKPPN